NNDAVQRMAGTRGGYGAQTEMPSPAAIFAKATPVFARLREDGRYDEGFRLAFGDGSVTSERIGDALEAYVASIRTGENGRDRFLAGRTEALDAAQQRGLELFRGKANCSQCHALDVKDGRAALTDGKFHDTGIAFAVPGGTAIQAERRHVTVFRMRGADLG